MVAQSGFIVYTTDAGSETSIKCSAATASFNGLALTKYPPRDTAWPFGRRNLRHVYGVSPAGRTYVMTVCDEGDFAALKPGSDKFNNSKGEQCTISAKVGERILFKYVS